MDFQPIKVAFLAGLVATKGFVVINLAALDAIVVTYRHRKAVDDVERPLIQAFPGFAQLTKQRSEQVCSPMPTPIEATFTSKLGI